MRPEGVACGRAYDWGVRPELIGILSVGAALAGLVLTLQSRTDKRLDALRAYVPPANGSRAYGIFRNSVVENVLQLADLIPQINITGSEKIKELARQLSQLSEVEPQVLRDDGIQRERTAD